MVRLTYSYVFWLWKRWKRLRNGTQTRKLVTERRSNQAVCNLCVSNNRNRNLKITRYKSLERNKQRSASCNDSRLGDGCHALLNCKNTNIVDNKKKYLPKYFVNYSPVKLKLLLQADKLIVHNLGALLSDVLTLFKKHGSCWETILVVKHCTVVLMCVCSPYQDVWSRAHKIIKSEI